MTGNCEIKQVCLINVFKKDYSEDKRNPWSAELINQYKDSKNYLLKQRERIVLNKQRSKIPTPKKLLSGTMAPLVKAESSKIAEIINMRNRNERYASPGVEHLAMPDITWLSNRNGSSRRQRRNQQDSITNNSRRYDESKDRYLQLHNRLQLNLSEKSPSLNWSGRSPKTSSNVFSPLTSTTQLFDTFNKRMKSL